MLPAFPVKRQTALKILILMAAPFNLAACSGDFWDSDFLNQDPLAWIGPGPQKANQRAYAQEPPSALGDPLNGGMKGTMGLNLETYLAQDIKDPQERIKRLESAVIAMNEDMQNMARALQLNNTPLMAQPASVPAPTVFATAPTPLYAATAPIPMAPPAPLSAPPPSLMPSLAPNRSATSSMFTLPPTNLVQQQAQRPVAAPNRSEFKPVFMQPIYEKGATGAPQPLTTAIAVTAQAQPAPTAYIPPPASQPATQTVISNTPLSSQALAQASAEIVQPGSAAAASGPSVGTSVRVGEHNDHIRLVIDVSKATDFTADLDNTENILIVELPNAGWSGPDYENLSGVGGVKSYKVEPAADGSIIVIQLSRASSILAQSKMPAISGGGQRIVIDLAK